MMGRLRTGWPRPDGEMTCHTVMEAACWERLPRTLTRSHQGRCPRHPQLQGKSLPGTFPSMRSLSGNGKSRWEGTMDFQESIFRGSFTIGTHRMLMMAGIGTSGEHQRSKAVRVKMQQRGKEWASSCTCICPKRPRTALPTRDGCWSSQDSNCARQKQLKPRSGDNHSLGRNKTAGAKKSISHHASSS
jgi:hypothetical protein